MSEPNGRPETQREVILRAASAMRQRASRAEGGPWEARDGVNHWSLHAVRNGSTSLQILRAAKRDTAGVSPGLATGDHIAAWPPEPALAAAALLESCARRPTEEALQLACAFLCVPREQYGPLVPSMSLVVLEGRLTTRFRVCGTAIAAGALVIMVTAPGVASVVAAWVLLAIAGVYFWAAGWPR